MKRALIVALLLFAGVLVCGTVRDANFWSTPDRRGDALMRAHQLTEAAKTYANPWRIGVAQYRNGDFEAAAKTFARVPGADGAFDQGNAWLMHGNYDGAIASYDRALGFKPSWKEAEENKAVAIARKAKIDASGKDRDQEAADAYKPDEVKFDQKGEDRKSQPEEMAESQTSDEELRATWLRQVKTTPGDFLRAKFAYQAAQADSSRQPSKEAAK